MTKKHKPGVVLPGDKFPMEGHELPPLGVYLACYVARASQTLALVASDATLTARDVGLGTWDSLKTGIMAALAAPVKAIKGRKASRATRKVLDIEGHLAILGMTAADFERVRFENDARKTWVKSVDAIYTMTGVRISSVMPADYPATLRARIEAQADADAKAAAAAIAATPKGEEITMPAGVIAALTDAPLALVEPTADSGELPTPTVDVTQDAAPAVVLGVDVPVVAAGDSPAPELPATPTEVAGVVQAVETGDVVPSQEADATPAPADSPDMPAQIAEAHAVLDAGAGDASVVEVAEKAAPPLPPTATPDAGGDAVQGGDGASPEAAPTGGDAPASDTPADEAAPNLVVSEEPGCTGCTPEPISLPVPHGAAGFTSTPMVLTEEAPASPLASGQQSETALAAQFPGLAGLVGEEPSQEPSASDAVADAADAAVADVPATGEGMALAPTEAQDAPLEATPDAPAGDAAPHAGDLSEASGEATPAPASEGDPYGDAIRAAEAQVAAEAAATEAALGADEGPLVPSPEAVAMAASVPSGDALAATVAAGEVLTQIEGDAGLAVASVGPAIPHTDLIPVFTEEELEQKAQCDAEHDIALANFSNNPCQATAVEYRRVCKTWNRRNHRVFTAADMYRVREKTAGHIEQTRDKGRKRGTLSLPAVIALPDEGRPAGRIPG